MMNIQYLCFRYKSDPWMPCRGIVAVCFHACAGRHMNIQFRHIAEFLTLDLPVPSSFEKWRPSTPVIGKWDWEKHSCLWYGVYGVGIEPEIFCMASRGLNVNTARFILWTVNLTGIWQRILGANSRIVEKEFQDTYFLPSRAHNFFSGAQQPKSGASRFFRVF